MTMMRKVLAGTDFSSAAQYAVNRAALLCGDTGAALELFNAVNFAGLSMLRRLVPGLPNGLEKRTIDERCEEVARLGGYVSEAYGVPVGTDVKAGPAFIQIENQACDVSADVIVLGHHGTSTLTHPIPGATASRLVETSSFPVLVVKQEPWERYSNVLVPVDFSEHSLPSLMLARAVAPKANIVLMHAYGVPFEGKLRAARVVDEELFPFLAEARKKVFENLHDLTDAAGLAPHAVRLVATHGDALHQILEHAETRHCDLIVMGRRGEAPLLERVFLGSVTKQVLALSRVDVLVTPNP